jgi:flagellar hook assembly protein FlgD
MTRFRRTLTLVAVLTVLAPGTAAAQEVRIVARDVLVDGPQSTLARPAPLSFTMVGIHWQGPGEVWFRTAPEPGRFGPWRPAQPEEEDQPDAGSDELDRSSAWHVGNPWWTRRASLIQYRFSGPVTRLRAYFVDSPVTAADRTRAASSRTAASLVATASGPVPQPAIIRRSGWNADESIVRGAPTIADRLRFSVVHHTAGSNSYSAAQSAAIVRGIQRYHVLGNGWDDIGYNFLVDKYGRVFEGRRGGIAQNVVGAHAGGFNTGSVGVAVLGNYQSAGFSSAARTALQNLLAWRLDVGHVFPRGRVTRVSAGSSKWPAGASVRLRAVSGHRDTSLTSCPGASIYGKLDDIALNANRIGLPKLYDPEAEGGVGGPVRFTGRLSATRAWLVRVKDAAGTVVAEGSGTGTAVGWTWNSSAAPVAFYTYTISAGADVRPATFPVPGPPPLALTGFSVAPTALTPNGDWSGEAASVRFGLTRRAVLGVRVVNASTSNLVRTLLASAERAAGSRTLTWDARNAGGTVVPDGQYRIEVSASDGAEQASRTANLVVDTTLGGFSASPRLVSLNGDGKAEPLKIGYALTRQAGVKVQIRRRGKTVHTVLSTTQPAGAYTVPWDGRGPGGRRIADGALTAVAVATTSLGTRMLSRPFTLDTAAPVIRVISFRRANGVVRLRFSLSEAAQVRIWFGRNRWNDGGYVDRAGRAGEQVFSRRTRARVFRIVATDAALNRAARIYRASR